MTIAVVLLTGAWAKRAIAERFEEGTIAGIRQRHAREHGVSGGHFGASGQKGKSAACRVAVEPYV